MFAAFGQVTNVPATRLFSFRVLHSADAPSSQNIKNWLSRTDGSIHRQSDVVFGKAGRGRGRTRDITQLRELQVLLEHVVAGIAMQHRGHPPREMFAAPHAQEA